MSSKHRVSVNLSESDYKELSALAEEHNVSMAWLGRYAICQLLENNKDQTLQLPLLHLGSHKGKLQ